LAALRLNNLIVPSSWAVYTKHYWELSIDCNYHFGRGENFYEMEDYINALDEYSVVAKLNSYDQRTRQKMTHCIYKTYDMLDMEYIQGSTFTMGCNDGPFNAQPAHLVELSSFYMDKKEVSNREFALFLNIKGLLDTAKRMRIDLDNPFCKITKSKEGWFSVKRGYEEYPVVCVSWYGANDYAEWIGKQLPTEAQWEYAFANSKIEQNRELQAVGSSIPNCFGLYNMSGNVWEWCFDWYFENYYKVSPKKDPVVINQSDCRVIRGGAYTSTIDKLDASYRDFNNPSECNKNVGFRCVKNIR